MKLRTLADVEALEQQGYDAVYPDQSPWEILHSTAQAHPEGVAIRYLADVADPPKDVVLTYGDFAAQVMAAARVFQAFGVVAGRGVILLAQHSASAQTALWGAQGVGHACPINPMLNPAHIAALIRAAHGSVLVVTGPNPEIDYWTDLIPALRAEGIDLPVLACDVEPGADVSAGNGVFEDLLRDHAQGPEITPDGDADTLAALYHTGGTTGAPKLVQHTRRNESHVGRSCALMHDLGRGDVVVNGFPLFHVAGAFVYGLATISAGGTTIMPGRLGMRNQPFMQGIWQQVERHKVTVIGVVPTILATLTGIKIDGDISSLRWLLTGGSPLPPELAALAERRTGKGVRNIFGMTETSGTISVEPVHAPRLPMSCGVRLPFCELAILGETDGEADPSKRLGPDQTGLIALRGPNVSPGYTDPARDAGTFLAGGWLVSGDLGRMDAQGHLFVTGRKKDVIIRGAHNIDPQMIEDALLAHDQVENAAAIGMPDAYAGELPVAFVTLRGGGTGDGEVTGEALIAFLRGRLEDPVALPKRIGLIDVMPVTPVGKIFKPALRRIAMDWAITKAVLDLGVGSDALGISISETLETRVAVPSTHLARVKDALAGMPITLEIVAQQ
ncbi:AMP-binding protein [Roseobacter sp. N2S]|uniref:AMP-binding protein n=1 Tax=Roseobacter sp. N2S TaxID=2663844 RepID=UPI0028547D91|nr:AMP-binding protein [Roseobacter sp. N2S]MDR6266998.1 fatty-acyl-CoA synthase [Roseobacter sp. N2S]